MQALGANQNGGAVDSGPLKKPVHPITIRQAMIEDAPENGGLGVLMTWMAVADCGTSKGCALGIRACGCGCAALAGLSFEEGRSCTADRLAGVMKSFKRAILCTGASGRHRVRGKDGVHLNQQTEPSFTE